MSFANPVAGNSEPSGTLRSQLIQILGILADCHTATTNLEDGIEGPKPSGVTNMPAPPSMSVGAHVNDIRAAVNSLLKRLTVLADRI
jgi:hypothetical protein